MTKKEAQNLLRIKMNYALDRANSYSSVTLNGISECNYYKGLAEGYKKAKELVGNIDSIGNAPKVKDLGVMIYRVSWEVYDDEGCCEIFYTDWTFDYELAQIWQKNLVDKKDINKHYVSVNEIEKAFVICDAEEIKGLNLYDKVFKLKEE